MPIRILAFMHAILSLFNPLSNPHRVFIGDPRWIFPSSRPCVSPWKREFFIVTFPTCVTFPWKACSCLGKTTPYHFVIRPYRESNLSLTWFYHFFDKYSKLKLVCIKFRKPDESEVNFAEYPSVLVENKFYG